MKILTKVLILLFVVSNTYAEEQDNIFNLDFSSADVSTTNRETERYYVHLDGSVSFNTLKAVKNKSLRQVEYAHAGAYAVRETIFDDVPMYGRIGASLSLLSDPRYLSANIEVSSGIRLPGTWSFYWGVGAMFGEIVECMYCTNEADKNGFVGVFPELGSHIVITENLRLGAFVRNYFLSDNLGDFFVWGGSISILND